VLLNPKLRFQLIHQLHHTAMTTVANVSTSVNRILRKENVNANEIEIIFFMHVLERIRLFTDNNDRRHVSCALAYNAAMHIQLYIGRNGIVEEYTLTDGNPDDVIDFVLSCMSDQIPDGLGFSVTVSSMDRDTYRRFFTTAIKRQQPTLGMEESIRVRMLVTNNATDHATSDIEVFNSQLFHAYTLSLGLQLAIKEPFMSKILKIEDRRNHQLNHTATYVKELAKWYLLPSQFSELDFEMEMHLNHRFMEFVSYDSAIASKEDYQYIIMTAAWLSTLDPKVLLEAISRVGIHVLEPANSGLPQEIVDMINEEVVKSHVVVVRNECADRLDIALRDIMIKFYNSGFVVKDFSKIDTVVNCIRQGGVLFDVIGIIPVFV
jgi:hypothetical protein